MQLMTSESSRIKLGVFLSVKLLVANWNGTWYGDGEGGVCVGASNVLFRVE